MKTVENCRKLLKTVEYGRTLDKISRLLKTSVTNAHLLPLCSAPVIFGLRTGDPMCRLASLNNLLLKSGLNSLKSSFQSQEVEKLLKQKTCAVVLAWDVATVGERCQEVWRCKRQGIRPEAVDLVGASHVLLAAREPAELSVAVPVSFVQVDPDGPVDGPLALAIE